MTHIVCYIFDNESHNDYLLRIFRVMISLFIVSVNIVDSTSLDNEAVRLAKERGYDELVKLLCQKLLFKSQ